MRTRRAGVAAAGGLRLLADDPGIGRALYLPRINDSQCETAPDMGAFEYCEDAPWVGRTLSPSEALGAVGRLAGQEAHRTKTR